MSEVIKNRYEFVVLFDVENGNPNGDPDAGNMPRIDPESGLGLVTDVCLKRKIRNYIETVKEDAEGYKIYIKDDVPLNRSDREACASVGVEETDEKKVTESLKKLKKNDENVDIKIRDYMCQNFFDIRTFGAVMTTFVKAALNCGQVRGPVQLGFARSIDPIVSQEVTITRVAITTEKDAANKSTEMGRKSVVPYGLYRVEGYVSANLARKVTGFSEEDLELLWEAIINMFEHDHSAARGNMAVRELIVFKHSKELGDCPAYKLFDSVEVRKKEEVEYPRSYRDYIVEVHEEDTRFSRNEKDDLMEYAEDDYLMLSGIQHFKFCRRQWALIHIEQQWAENVHTVVGELMHKKAHDPYLVEKRKDLLVARSLPIASRKMGISGECDVVEFHRCEDGVKLHGHRGDFSVYPIEYKKGKPKLTEEDRLQLAAQAMCLEEMFSTDIPEGALFYGETRRREVVEITEDLRQEVRNMFQEMHQYFERKYTPKVKYSKSCTACSLKDICLPKLGKSGSVKDYIHQMLKEDEE